METAALANDYPALELKNVEKRFGDFAALQGLSFCVPNGAFVAIVVAASLRCCA